MPVIVEYDSEKDRAGTADSSESRWPPFLLTISLIQCCCRRERRCTRRHTSDDDDSAPSMTSPPVFRGLSLLLPGNFLLVPAAEVYPSGSHSSYVAGAHRGRLVFEPHRVDPFAVDKRGQVLSRHRAFARQLNTHPDPHASGPG